MNYFEGHNGHKLLCGRFCLNIRKHFFTVRVIKQWLRLLRDVVVLPYLEIFNNHLDVVLCNWV